MLSYDERQERCGETESDCTVSAFNSYAFYKICFCVLGRGERGDKERKKTMDRQT